MLASAPRIDPEEHLRKLDVFVAEETTKYNQTLRSVSELRRKYESAVGRGLTTKHCDSLNRRVQSAARVAEAFRSNLERASQQQQSMRNLIQMQNRAGAIARGGGVTNSGQTTGVNGLLPPTPKLKQMATAPSTNTSAFQLNPAMNQSRHLALKNAAVSSSTNNTQSSSNDDDEINIIDSNEKKDGDYKCPYTLAPFKDPYANINCSHHIDAVSLKQELIKSSKPKTPKCKKPGEKPKPPLGSFHCPVYGCSQLWTVTSYRKDNEFLKEIQLYFNKDKDNDSSSSGAGNGVGNGVASGDKVNSSASSSSFSSNSSSSNIYGGSGSGSPAGEANSTGKRKRPEVVYVDLISDSEPDEPAPKAAKSSKPTSSASSETDAETDLDVDGVGDRALTQPLLPRVRVIPGTGTNTAATPSSSSSSPLSSSVAAASAAALSPLVQEERSISNRIAVLEATKHLVKVVVNRNSSKTSTPSAVRPNADPSSVLTIEGMG